MKRSKGVVHFHQGWSDVINCMGLVDYYTKTYENITVVSRHYMRNMVDFYFRDTKINVVYSQVDDTDILANQLVEYYGEDALFHGFHDRYRSDAYKNAFATHCHSQEAHFVRLFYEAYGIPYSLRVDGFKVSRDRYLEDRVRHDFCQQHGSDYVLYHADGDRQVAMPEFNALKTINLNGMTDNPFRMLSVLENARELHLADSLWATLCYVMDAKYGMLKHVPVFLYPFGHRSGGCCRSRDVLKLEPVDLPNWKICK
jgi:hypothetical protein